MNVLLGFEDLLPNDFRNVPITVPLETISGHPDSHRVLHSNVCVCANAHAHIHMKSCFLYVSLVNTNVIYSCSQEMVNLLAFF